MVTEFRVLFRTKRSNWLHSFDAWGGIDEYGSLKLVEDGHLEFHSGQLTVVMKGITKLVSYPSDNILEEPSVGIFYSDGSRDLVAYFHRDVPDPDLGEEVTEKDIANYVKKFMPKVFEEANRNGDISLSKRGTVFARLSNGSIWDRMMADVIVEHLGWS